MELRNLVFNHIILIVVFNMTFSFIIMSFSGSFLFKSDDISHKSKPSRLANQIAFYINFLSFYIILIIIFSYCFTKDGQVIFDAFKKISNSENKTLPFLIIDFIINGIYFLFIYIFYWPIYTIIKYFGKFNSRYVTMILIICIDILVFFSQYFLIIKMLIL